MKRPWLRFFGIGLLLFVVRAFVPDGPEPLDLPPLAPPVTDEELLTRVALERGYHRSDAIVRRRLARNMRFATTPAETSDTDLVEEAIALGMHTSDLVVRRRLAQKVTLEIQERARHPEPADADLQAYLDANAERFTEPARVRTTQIYFREAAAAATALPELAARPTETKGLGDALPIPRALPPLSERELGRQLGPDFARAVMALPDETWSGPIASAYGHHLVFVHERRAEKRSELSVIRAEVRESLFAERGAALLRETIDRWRAERGLERRGGSQG